MSSDASSPLSKVAVLAIEVTLAWARASIHAFIGRQPGADPWRPGRLPDQNPLKFAPRYTASLSIESHCAAETLLSFFCVLDEFTKAEVGSEALILPREPAPLIFGRCPSSRSPARLGVHVQPS